MRWARDSQQPPRSELEIIKSPEDGWIGLCNAEYFAVVIGTENLSRFIRRRFSCVLFGS